MPSTTVSSTEPLDRRRRARSKGGAPSRARRSYRYGLVAVALCSMTALASARDTVTSLLEALESDPEKRAIAAEPIRLGKEALDRSKSAQQAGDSKHALLLRGVAEEWALVARDQVRAAQAEREASKVETRVNELETKIVRARALLEETIARRGRAAAKLDELEPAEKNPRGDASAGDGAQGKP